MENKRYSELYPSVTSVIGNLVNCPIRNEEERISDLDYDDQIIKISNNFGCKMNPNFIFKAASKQKESNRIKTGIGEFAGTHFNSQTTYTVAETEDMFEKRKELLDKIPQEFKKDMAIEKKYFKIKHFTNGCIQIPGILHEDLSDAKSLLEIVINKLSSVYNVKVELRSELSSSMRNYKCKIILDNEEKIDLKYIRTKIVVYKYQQNIFGKYYMNCIENNHETFQGLRFKLFKTKNDENDFNLEKNISKNDNIKTITIKIFQDGKINIDSVSDINEAKIIYEWIKTLFDENAFYYLEKNESEYYTSDEDNPGYAVPYLLRKG